MSGEKLPKAMSFGFVILFFLGVGSVALAFHTFPDRLKSPFRLLPPSAENPLAFSGDLQDELESSIKDTDQDGVPDVREREVYGTSPYLPDTDSDGLSDKQEIDEGGDPNCPKGTDCLAFRFPSARDVEQEQIIKSLYESTLSAKLAESGIPGLTDAPAIRNFLRQAGISEDILGQFDDKMLVQIFQESARSSMQNSSLTPPPSSSTPTSLGSGQQEGREGQLPENPTPNQIRELLTGAGVEKSVLEKFNDEQLVKLYQDTLKTVQKE